MANKKSFIDNMDGLADPTMNFISKKSTEQKTEPTREDTTQDFRQHVGKPPAGYKINPMYIETKSRRLQLLIQPSLHEALKEKARREHNSVNDVIHTILQEAIRKEKENIG